MAARPASLDSQLGGGFLARHLWSGELHAHGGDVLIRLLPDPRRGGQLGIRADVLVVLGGYLILAGSWVRQDRRRRPEQIRPATAFAMGMITELEENSADVGARHRVRWTTRRQPWSACRWASPRAERPPASPATRLARPQPRGQAPQAACPRGRCPGSLHEGASQVLSGSAHKAAASEATGTLRINVAGPLRRDSGVRGGDP